MFVYIKTAGFVANRVDPELCFVASDLGITLFAEEKPVCPNRYGMSMF